MKNLNIYFSDACNFHCAYCCMGNGHNDNKHIRDKLASGEFSDLVKKTITKDTVSLGLWGMEPALNSDLFARFIIPILNNNPQIKSIMFSTNGRSSIYRDMILPLLKYNITLHIQFNIDGPKEINDLNRQDGAFNTSIQSLYTLVRSCPMKVSSQFKLKLSTKSTLTKLNLRTDPNKWYTWAETLRMTLEERVQSKPYIDVSQIGAKPTIEVPGRYFGYDAELYKKWFGIIDIPQQTLHCAAGISSFTIDCDGNLWDCQMRKNKIGYDEQLLRSNFDKRVDQLLKDNQITQTNKDMLFNAIMSVWCWASASDINKIDDSYILLFGNL